MQHPIKVVGLNSQVLLEKQFADKMIVIDQVDKGTWIIKSAEFIPDSEKWLHQAGTIGKLDKSIEWAEKNSPKANFNKVIKELENGSNKNRSNNLVILG